MAFRCVVIAVVAFLCVETLSALTLTKRSLPSIASANTSAETEICQGRAPCGWAVYSKLSRHIDYFMKNKCECNVGKKCLKDDDDISLTAYVYRCKFNTDDGPKNIS